LEQNVPAQKAEPPSRLVTVAPDRTISVTASRIPLQSILNEISAQTRVPIVLAEALEHVRVSATIRGVPLEEALKQLLADCDTFYLFGARDNKAPSIKAVWVYPKGEGETIEPVPPEVWGSTKDLKAQIDDPEVGARTEAIETLIERLGDKGIPIVLKGLADGDGIVRLATLSAAADSDIDIPTPDLQSLVLTDPSPASGGWGILRSS
jgi:hypothetical protein